MKIKIDQKQLSKCIGIVQKAISTKTTLPILEGILIETIDNRLKITATDLELGIESYIDCEVIEEGSFVVTAKIFGDIIRKLPNETVDIEVKENYNIEINCGHSKFNLIGQPSEEYPQLPKISDEVSFDIPQDLLKIMIKQTIFATAQDETRPILTGALLEISNNSATLVALDGYRLAVKKVSINCNEDIKVVIPGKSLNELSKILEDDENDINIKFTKGHIIFNLGDTVISSRLLEGQFLNYKDIIRNEYNSKVVVNTNDIKQSIERASLLVKEGKNNLIKFSVSDDKMLITSNSEIGNVHEEVPIKLEGNDVEIAFNSKYILDGIRVIDSKEIIMNFVSDINPCIINPTEDNKYTYLILPVRLPGSN
ncbi:DNA polymerase III subunit beta [Dethiothermospora halolimnae]|uniref:DNA polymerase III subunit beta n=1 Tax=Dethiothermospora halolimnae TaxID=3114390 RepID=UPI003CCB90E1